MAEKDYVLRGEYEADKGKIYRKINEEKSDTNQRMGELDKLLHVFIESQRPIQDGFKDIKGELVKVNENLSSFSEHIDDHGRRIKTIEDSATAKSKHNTAIWVAVIGGGFTLLGTALGLAQFFF